MIGRYSFQLMYLTVIGIVLLLGVCGYEEHHEYMKSVHRHRNGYGEVVFHEGRSYDYGHEKKNHQKLHTPFGSKYRSSYLRYRANGFVKRGNNGFAQKHHSDVLKHHKAEFVQNNALPVSKGAKKALGA